jgi:hypothetical protein
MMAIGNRGGGKTWVCALLMVTLALALPATWQIGVSITSKQNREIKAAIIEIAEPSWISLDVTDLRDPRTTVITGTNILWLTSKNSKALRQALLPFELVFINEGQDQSEGIFVNAVGAIRNRGGLVAVATNPPREAGGDWVAILHQGIEAGSAEGAAYVLDAAHNTAIHQPTRHKIGRLLKLVNPEAAEADADGVFKLSGRLAYPAFSPLPRERNGHIGEPPAIGWRDITAQVTKADPEVGVSAEAIAGGDFQIRPGLCTPMIKIYEDERGRRVLYVFDFVAARGAEEDLSLALMMRGYGPAGATKAIPAVILADGTGERQNAAHNPHANYSYERLSADGWVVVAPFRHPVTGRAHNPPVRDSRAQMHSLLTARQILISPRLCEAMEGFPSLHDCFSRAKALANGKLDKKGHLQHGPDGVRYVAWRYMPLPFRGNSPAFNRAAFDDLSAIRIARSDA